MLWLSQIFKWYEKDFAAGAGGLFGKLTAGQLLPALRPSLEPAASQAIEEGTRYLFRCVTREIGIVSLDFFDWSLNGRR